MAKKKTKEEERMIELLSSETYKTRDGFFTKRGRLIDLVALEKEIARYFECFLAKKIKELISNLENYGDTFSELPRDLFNADYKSDKDIEIPALLKIYYENDISDFSDLVYFLADMVQHKTDYFLIIKGVDRSGKSMLMNMIKASYKNFASAITINQLSNEFMLIETLGKLIVLGDDLGKAESFGRTSGLIKSMVAGEEIIANKKFLTPQKIKSHANFIFNTNVMPQIDYQDVGVLRRTVIIDFDKKLDLKNYEYHDIYKNIINNKEEQKNFLKYFVNKKIDKDYIKYLRLKYRIKLLENSTIIKLCPKQDILENYYDYEDYCSLCSDSGYKSYSLENFESVIKEYQNCCLEMESYEEEQPPY